jgi:hypothetical protein
MSSTNTSASLRASSNASLRANATLNVPTELRTLEQRQERAQMLASKYPNRLALIIRSAKDDGPTNKFVVPLTCTVADVLQHLRKRINVTAYQAIYLCVHDSVLSGAQTMESIISYKSDDGFVYLTYCMESVFGGEVPSPLTPLTPLP